MNAKIEIDPDSDVSLFQQIVNGIEKMILTGDLSPGDLLPSIREFAVSYSINPNTVAKSYQQLQATGLVKTERGIGLRVQSIKSDRKQKRRMEMIDEKVLELVELSKSLNISNEELIEKIKNLKGRT